MKVQKKILYVCGFALGLVLVSIRCFAGYEYGSFYDVFGISNKPKGKFATDEFQGSIMKALPSPQTNPLLIESTLSRQIYQSAINTAEPDPNKKNCFDLGPVTFSGSPPNQIISGTEIFNTEITTQNLSSANKNVIEIIYSTQVFLRDRAPSSTQDIDSIGLLCTVSQPDSLGSTNISSAPCSQTATGFLMLRQGQDVGGEGRLTAANYAGYVQVDNGLPTTVKIEMATFFGSRATACFNNLIVRTR